MVLSDNTVRELDRPIPGPEPSTSCLANRRLPKRPHASPPAPSFDDEIEDANTPTPKRKQRKANYTVIC